MYSIHDVFYLLQAVFHKIFRYVIFFCGCGYISVLFFKPSVLGPTNDDSDIELDDYTALYDEDTSDDFEEKVKGSSCLFRLTRGMGMFHHPADMLTTQGGR